MSDDDKKNTKVQVMLEALGRDVEELRDSEAWKAMLKVQARFHRYSASNLLMIYLQAPTATRVAGYRTWQGLGRQVLKGEKGIKIFAPMTKKDEAGERKLVGFKMVSVFDLAQTEGDDLPTVAWPQAEAAPAGLWSRLTERAEQLGFPLILDPGDGDGRPGARGWFSPLTKEITIRPAEEPSMCATLLHELGHALDPALTEDQDRARRELVAESVAFVLAQQLGLDCADEVTHYLASWGGGVDGLLAVMERVRVAVHAFDPPVEQETAA